MGINMLDNYYRIPDHALIFIPSYLYKKLLINTKPTTTDIVKDIHSLLTRRELVDVYVMNILIYSSLFKNSKNAASINAFVPNGQDIEITNEAIFTVDKLINSENPDTGLFSLFETYITNDNYTKDNSSYQVVNYTNATIVVIYQQFVDLYLQLGQRNITENVRQLFIDILNGVDKSINNILGIGKTKEDGNIWLGIFFEYITRSYLVNIFYNKLK